MITADSLRLILADFPGPLARIRRVVELLKSATPHGRIRLHLPNNHFLGAAPAHREGWETEDLAGAVMRTGREAGGRGLRAVPLFIGSAIAGVLVRGSEEPLPDDTRLALDVLTTELASLARWDGVPDAPEIVGRSPAQAGVLDRLRRLAPRRSPVLLYGERGTGKELHAALIHRWSGRGAGPFVRQSAAGIPESLAESELMGHRAGSFTDARRDRRGLFQQADGGTLFLDEVAQTPRRVQAVLLRVLSEREIVAVGSEAAEIVDVRVIAASNVDLRDKVEAGEFLPDLLDRLCEETVRLPPLRERPQDIESLVRKFLGSFAPRQIPADVLDLLGAQAWPGNVRELRKVCAQILVHSEGHLTTATVATALASIHHGLHGDPAPSSNSPLTLPDLLKDAEARAIEQRLALHGGRAGDAARSLGVPERTLRYRRRRGRRGER